MKTSSAYPVLDNRPIDQWKVTELKEELKRRKLTTRGLKEELVRRLDESLRSEMEAEKEEADNGVDEPESDNIAEAVVTEQTDDETVELGLGTPETAKENVGDESDDGDRVINVGDAGDRMTGVDDESVQVDSAVSVELPADGKGQEQDVLVQADSRDSIEQPVDGKGLEEQDVSVQFNSKDSIEQPVDSKGQEEQDVSLQADSKDSFEQPVEDKVQEEEELGLVSDQSLEVGTFTANDMSSAGLGNEISEGFSSENAADDKGMPDGIMGRDDEGSRAPEPAEDLKPLHEDGKLDSSDSNNQVSEVSSSLGFPIKSNSISTDSVSINEKNDLKDNIIADNVKLESDVKPEMVQPSSELVPDGGKSHPCDVEEPYENKVSVQETDNNVTNADLSQKNYSADLGSSEKLNLDRSSGDDSMEEDALESKHIDSNYNSEEVVEKTEKNEVTAIKEERPVATMDIDKPEKEKDTNHEYNIVDAASTDKRKLSDQEAVLNNEPSKRQRRWKSESNHVKEPQILDIPPPQVVVKDVPQPAVLKRNLSASDSSGGANEPPKEREVPPSSKPATDSLRIDRFLRPFTLKAVQELLAKTGTVTSFWMDHIKTHCYVTYSSVEEAVETRNAVFNLQWPPNGGRHLVAEFVDPEEVKARLEKPPPSPATPVSSGPAVSEPAPTMPQPSPRQQNSQTADVAAAYSTTATPFIKPTSSQGIRPSTPPPPPLNEKVEAPILTLDDLFKKTKATPRIYYLPLSEEQVAGVLEARSKSSKQ